MLKKYFSISDIYIFDWKNKNAN